MKTLEFEYTTGETITCHTAEGPVAITVADIDEVSNEVWFHIDAPHGVTIQVDGQPRETLGTPACRGLPRLWLMFSLALSGRIKREVFIPSFNDFVEDYLYAKKSYHGKWERRWVNFAFTARSFWMVATCFRIQIWGAICIAARFLWNRLHNE